MRKERGSLRTRLQLASSCSDKYNIMYMLGIMVSILGACGVGGVIIVDRRILVGVI